MMSKQAVDLSKVLPPEYKEGPTQKLDDYMDTPLFIHTCREVTGQNGPYMRMVVSETEDGDQFYISTGASQAVEILAYLKSKNLFPVKGKFVRAGRAILLQGVE